jgi:hypothetical protein
MTKLFDEFLHFSDTYTLLNETIEPGYEKIKKIDIIFNQ